MRLVLIFMYMIIFIYEIRMRLVFMPKEIVECSLDIQKLLLHAAMPADGHVAIISHTGSHITADRAKTSSCGTGGTQVSQPGNKHGKINMQQNFIRGRS